MGNFLPGKLTASSPVIMIGELALAADRSLWADNQTECISIIGQIYDVFDAREMGLEPAVRSRILAAETAAWVGGKPLNVEFWSSVYAPG